MADFWSKSLQKMKSVQKVSKVSLPTISRETTESVTLNDKTNPQPTAETPPSTANTAAPTLAPEEAKKINTENDILVGLYRKRDFWQLAKSDRKEIGVKVEGVKGHCYAPS